MKFSALHKFRYKLKAGEPLYGLWVTLEAAAVSDIAAGLGFDWIVIDADRGHLDWAEVLEHVRATVRSDTVALVRIAEASQGVIERVINAGADGIVVSKIETAAQLQSIMQWSRRAFVDMSGMGLDRATCWESDIAQQEQESTSNMLVVPMVEASSLKGGIDRILEIDGVEIFFFNSAVSEDANVLAVWDSIVRELHKRGKYAATVATSAESLVDYRSHGFSVLGVGCDSAIISHGIRKLLEAVGRTGNSESIIHR